MIREYTEISLNLRLFKSSLGIKVRKQLNKIFSFVLFTQISLNVSCTCNTKKAPKSLCNFNYMTNTNVLHYTSYYITSYSVLSYFRVSYNF